MTQTAKISSIASRSRADIQHEQRPIRHKLEEPFMDIFGFCHLIASCNFRGIFVIPRYRFHETPQPFSPVHKSLSLVKVLLPLVARFLPARKIFPASAILPPIYQLPLTAHCQCFRQCCKNKRLCRAEPFVIPCYSFGAGPASLPSLAYFSATRIFRSNCEPFW